MVRIEAQWPTAVVVVRLARLWHLAAVVLAGCGVNGLALSDHPWAEQVEL